MATTYTVPTYTGTSTSYLNPTSTNITLPSVGGGSGSYYISNAISATGYVSSTSMNTSTISLNSSIVELVGKNPVLATENSKINVDEMIGVVKMMQEIFCILPKNQSSLDSNPTLKDSYEQYVSILQKTMQKFNDPALLEAYNQYKTLEILSQKEENNDDS
jgi:hypothetical protein